jgi:hypothetical protein
MIVYIIFSKSLNNILGANTSTEGIQNVQNLMNAFLIKNQIEIIPNGLFDMMLNNSPDPLPKAL